MADLLIRPSTKQMEHRTSTKTQRIHGIDALRAIAMLLGVVFHATIAYKVTKTSSWPQDPTFQNWIFDFSYFIIHSFRMPLFFLIAGYFCRFLYYKIGEKEFIKHRVKRILIPFLVSLVVILPFTIFPFLVNTYSNVYRGQWPKILQAAQKQLLHWNGLAHLWFLYYLLIYYTLMIILLRLHKTKTFSKPLNQLNSATFLFEPKSVKGIGIAAVSIWAVLIMVPELYLNVDTGFIPAVPYLLYYAVFFVFGWLINRMPVPFSVMMKNVWWFLSISIALNIGLFLMEFNGLFDNLTTIEMLVIKFFVALQVIFMVYGMIGLFLRYIKSESRTWRYISDASYWIYLLHLGLVCGLQVVLMTTNQMAGILKFPLIIIVTTVLTVTSYHYLVRNTIIGEYLHGKRKKQIE